MQKVSFYIVKLPNISRFYIIKLPILRPDSFELNSFLPTGQFFAPKLIILIKCLIDILFFKVMI